MKLALCVAATILAATAAVAQDSKFADSVNVTVVEVPVTVVDRTGKPVRGLTQDQFEVTVDGKKVAIGGFDVVDIAALADEPASTPLPPVAYRNFLLLFDLAHSSPGTIGRAKAAAKELVTNGLTRRDVAAIATHSIEKGLSVVTSFTADRALLLDAIETLGDPEYFKAPDPLRIARESSPVTVNPDQAGKMRGVGAGGADALAAERNMLQSMAEGENQRAGIRKQLQQFGSVARLLDGLAGQKQVVLLSEGFDTKIIEGRGAKLTNEEKEQLEKGEVWKVTSEQHFGSAQSAAEINEMAEIFQRSDVKLHAIDIKGLRSGVDAKEGVKNVSNDALYYLARPTGGMVIDHDTRLTESFARLLEQQEVVYVVAFSTPRTFEPNRFHKIHVKVRVPGNPRVSHRQGFYEKSPYPDSPLQQQLTLADALMKDADVKDVTLSLVAVALPSVDGDARVPVVIELPGDKLLAAGEETITTELYVYAFDEKNQVRDFLQQRLGLDVARHGEKLRAGGLRYVTSLKLPPGKHVIKALARVEETGRIGLARAVVTVPAASNAIFFGEPSAWINVAAPGRGDDAIAAFSADGRKFSPSANPSLRKDGAVNLAVYGSSGEVRAAVIGVDGLAEPVTLPVIATDETKVLLEFKPPQLAGQYRLRLDVGNSRVDLPFRVE